MAKGRWGGNKVTVEYTVVVHTQVFTTSTRKTLENKAINGA